MIKTKIKNNGKEEIIELEKKEINEFFGEEYYENMTSGLNFVKEEFTIELDDLYESIEGFKKFMNDYKIYSTKKINKNSKHLKDIYTIIDLSTRENINAITTSLRVNKDIYFIFDNNYKEELKKIFNEEEIKNFSCNIPIIIYEEYKEYIPDMLWKKICKELNLFSPKFYFNAKYINKFIPDEYIKYLHMKKVNMLYEMKFNEYFSMYILSNIGTFYFRDVNKKITYPRYKIEHYNGEFILIITDLYCLNKNIVNDFLKYENSEKIDFDTIKICLGNKNKIKFSDIYMFECI